MTSTTARRDSEQFTCRWRPLDSGWTLRISRPDPQSPVAARTATFDAAVPGCVHTDLLRAGTIPDPYLDLNENDQHWVGRSEWCYETTFDWQPDAGARTDLVCEGLDTIARVELNGRCVGKTANMHRAYRFDVGGLLRAGANTLTVVFAPIGRWAEQVRARIGERPNVYPEPFNFVRKMACNFGWDWGPTLITAGIWKPIGLQTWSVARLAAVRPTVTVEAGVGTVHLEVDIEHALGSAEDLTLAATVAGVRRTVTVPATVDRTSLELEVPDVELWWPRSHGDQPLYDLEVELTGDSDQPAIDSWSKRVGFRSVALDLSEDDIGSAFTIVVNGRPIFVRGVNWIPDDCFPTRVGRDRYAERLEQAAAANVDLVRVWGGGIYESDDFYEHCDALGIMVWQDFLFACAAYPEEEPQRAEVEAEARDAINRLMSHPSLVLWNGNNENIWGWFDWNWREPVGEQTWGAGYYFDLLPSLVDELDPSRPYWPGSPYSGSMDLHPNDDRHGNSHVWDVWNDRGYTAYRDHRPRFASEFGFQAPATFATIESSLTDRPLEPDSVAMLHHQRAGDGNHKLHRGLADHFHRPDTFDDWLFLTQLNQARALTLGIEHFRSLRPRCMGTIVWQLNDCWPVTSWSAIDGYGRLKPLWYALRRAYRPQLVTVQPRDERLVAVMLNETAVDWDVTGVARRVGLDGAVHAEVPMALSCPAGSSAVLELPADVAHSQHPDSELLVVDLPEQRAWWFFAPDKDLHYPVLDLAAAVEAVQDGYAITVTANSFVRDLSLFVDRLDPHAEVDEMLVTLLPGESHRFHVRTDSELDPRLLVRAPVLRCVNDAPVETGGGR